MGNFQDVLYASLAQFVQDKTGIEVKEVTGYHDWGKSDGCDTCGYGSTYDLEISYVDNQGDHRSYSYDGPFSELIQDLTVD